MADSIRDAWAAGHPLVIYGAGGAGKEIARALHGWGIQITAFLDAGAAPGEVRDGIHCYTLESWAHANQVRNFDVLISIHNCAVRVAPIIDALRVTGFAHVLTIIDYVNLFPEHKINRNWLWLVPSDYYSNKQDKIVAVSKILADDISRQWFEATINLRLEGNYHGLPEPISAEQYMPADLPRWKTPIRMIDCGAYDGDTIDAFIRNNYQFENLVAFEPDHDNYMKLATRFPDLNAIYLPCGVASTAKTIQFDGGHGVSSRGGGGTAKRPFSALALTKRCRPLPQHS